MNIYKNQNSPSFGARIGRVDGVEKLGVNALDSINKALPILSDFSDDLSFSLEGRFKNKYDKSDYLYISCQQRIGEEPPKPKTIFDKLFDLICPPVSNYAKDFVCIEKDKISCANIIKTVQKLVNGEKLQAAKKSYELQQEIDKLNK